MCVYIHVHVHLYKHVCTYMYMYIYTNSCGNVCLYVYNVYTCIGWLWNCMDSHNYVHEVNDMQKHLFVSLNNIC